MCGAIVVACGGNRNHYTQLWCYAVFDVRILQKTHTLLHTCGCTSIERSIALTRSTDRPTAYRPAYATRARRWLLCVRSVSSVIATRRCMMAHTNERTHAHTHARELDRASRTTFYFSMERSRSHTSSVQTMRTIMRVTSNRALVRSFVLFGDSRCQSVFLGVFGTGQSSLHLCDSAISNGDAGQQPPVILA